MSRSDYEVSSSVSPTLGFRESQWDGEESFFVDSDSMISVETTQITQGQSLLLSGPSSPYTCSIEHSPSLSEDGPTSNADQVQQQHRDALGSSATYLVDDTLLSLDPPTSRSRASSYSWTGTTEWLPLSLSKAYLISLSFTSLALGMCCFVLSAYSHLHDGISNRGSSNVSKFYRRFLPTLVAVSYTLLWRPVVVNIVRTEPWALLSLSTGSKARHSLLKTDRMWWNHLVDSCRTKCRPGGIRWALLVSVVAGLMASIVVNALSAGLFDTRSLLVTTERQFVGFDLSTSNVRPWRIGDITYLRAVTNLLFNVSTSAWTTDEYTVVPFWPPGSDIAPLAASLTDSVQLWRGQRDVLVARVQCRPFTTISTWKDEFNRSIPYLETDDGCSVRYQRAYTYDGRCSDGKWGEINNWTSPTAIGKCLSKGYHDYYMFCSPNATSTGLLHEGSYDFTKQFPRYYSGQACNTSYLTANVSVNVSTSFSKSVVTIEQASFVEMQRPMNLSSLKVRDFEDEFIQQTGATHLQPELDNLESGDLGVLSNFEGPALLLAIGNNYSVDGLMQMDPTKLEKRAAVIKQRFLGEVLLSRFSDLTNGTNTSPIQTMVTERETRLVVNLAIGATLGSVFCLLAGAAMFLAFLVTLKKRPLQLIQDPQKSSVAALSLIDSQAIVCLEGLDRSSSTEIAAALQSKTFSTRAGRLNWIRSEPEASGHKTRFGSPSPPPTERAWIRYRRRNSTKSGLDWRPFNLKRRSGALLLLVLTSVAAALIALYCVSERQPLTQSALIYHSDLNIGEVRLTTIAPYSIVPTLMAVGLKLWWATIDSAYRRLSPFVAMAEASNAKAINGIALSYITTPTIWITLLAVRNGHWMLAVVTFGTLTSEVLQVSMSALWERKAAVRGFSAVLNSQLEIRTVPLVFQSTERAGHADQIAYPSIAKHLYGGKLYQTSWIYGGLAESAFGALPPSWSKDGWNFPPVDIISALKNLPKPPKFAREDVADSVLNVTFNSIGLRGRVECTPIDNSSRWFSEKTATWNGNIAEGYYTNSSMPNKSLAFEFTPEVRMVDLPWVGTSPNIVTIGQWLHSNYSSSYGRGDPLYKPSNSRNFTVLWIQANRPWAANNTKNLSPRRIWAKRPHVQALDCRPIFETSRFRIIVNAETSQIRHYTMLEAAREAASAWTDGFTKHLDTATANANSSTSASFNGSDIRVYNTTVSWGYLFQLALLQAGNVQGFYGSNGTLLSEGIPGPTPFSFIEPDLYLDPYSYASLSSSSENRTDLLNASTLIGATQGAFSTFFQWFVSSPNGYTNESWSYQPVSAKLPPNLGSVTFDNITASTMKIVLFKTVVVTLRLNESQPATSYRNSYSLVRTSSTPVPAPTLTPKPTLSKRDAPTLPADNSRIIHATISWHTETLVISKPALFLSISILSFLIMSTLVIYLLQNRQLCLLPRDYDSPASLLASVYASEKLKAWVKENYEKQKLRQNTGRWTWERPAEVDDNVAVKMGYFTGADGEQHWGIEIVDDDQPLTEKESLDDGSREDGEEMEPMIPLEDILLDDLDHAASVRTG